MSNESTHVPPYIGCFICGSEIGTYCYLMIYQVSLFLSPIDSADGPQLCVRKSSTEYLETSRCRNHDSSEFCSIFFFLFFSREIRSIFEHSGTANWRAVEYTLRTMNGRGAYLHTNVNVVCVCVFAAPLFGSIQFITETTQKTVHTNRGIWRNIHTFASYAAVRYIRARKKNNIYIRRLYLHQAARGSRYTHVHRTHPHRMEKLFRFVCHRVLDVSTGASCRLTRIEITANQTERKKK